MANSDLQSGARPKGQPLRMNKYRAFGTIYPNDFVKRDAQGGIVVATAGAAVAGVAAQYGVSGDDIMVWDHPEQLFIVQASATEVDAQTDIGLNASILANAGDSTYRASRHELDSSTLATTATLELKLLGIDVRPDNALGDNVDCIVKINNHQYGASTGSAGV